MEATGRTVLDATRQALAQLSVTEDDAEVVVLSEPKPGLFGRVRSEARVRARVRPANAKPRKAGAGGHREQRPRAVATREAKATVGQPGLAEKNEQDVSTGDSDDETMATGETMATDEAATNEITAKVTANQRNERDGGGFGEDVSLTEQAEVARTFLIGVLDRFGSSASVGVTEVDDGVAEVAITGDDLALLVGARGSTVDALQDLARVVVQRRTGARHGRLLVDVAGYRLRRRGALEAFARERAEEVLRDGVEQALEPMGPADRKVVHDTVNKVDGVVTHSEGEEPRRRVVISPAS
ncbi:MAG: RNA-binding cell elongation regulator Jag/EloR [Acidimicrobiales bacterium]